MKFSVFGLIAWLSISVSAVAETSSPEGAKVYFITPTNGALVSETFSVLFGLSGMSVAPAGTVKANTGHHHLLVDGAELPELDQPMGQGVMHFDAGQTETILTLPAGDHTLQLILGDMSHVPHLPAVVSEKITVTVK